MQLYLQNHHLFVKTVLSIIKPYTVILTLPATKSNLLYNGPSIDKTTDVLVSKICSLISEIKWKPIGVIEWFIRKITGCQGCLRSIYRGPATSAAATFLAIMENESSSDDEPDGPVVGFDFNIVLRHIGSHGPFQCLNSIEHRVVLFKTIWLEDQM